VSEFAVPAIPPPAGSSPGTAGTPATLEDITPGPDGALWFTGVPGEVGRITTAGVVSEFATPNFSPPSNGIVTTITTGPDGNLWLMGNTTIGRITPTGTFTSFDVPGNFQTIGGLTTGPDGNLWFTEQEDGQTAGEQPAVGEITPTGVTKLYALPLETTLNPNVGVPTDTTVITTGPDGRIWFGETGAIGRITTAGKRRFPLQTPAATVEDITQGRYGAVWFVQDLNQSISIGRLSTRGTITMYPLSPNSTSASITAGPGGLWFAENLSDTNPESSGTTFAIGRITARGQIKTFDLPQQIEQQYNASGGNITVGPDGNLWFLFSYGSNSFGTTIEGDIGRITAKGNVKMFNVFSTENEGSYTSAGPSDIISGPDGKLWYQGTVDGTTGIARISTSGKLGPVIPVGPIDSNMVRQPNGLVWFESEAAGADGVNELGVATRSGIVATQDLPASSPYIYANSNSQSNAGVMTIGPNGTLWATNGTSGIVRISGLDTVAGGLDYRHRPQQAPDYSYSQWTNVSGSANPTFSGVAKPGAEVALRAQKQGDNQAVSIGRVKASKIDGSWTLTSHVALSDGNYAVTAAQTGSTGPPSVLYSLAPDSYGDLSNALVIAASPAGNGKAVQRSSHIAHTKAVPSGDTSLHHAASRPKRSASSAPRS